jgi:uncharacterized DUF497 family protein
MRQNKLKWTSRSKMRWAATEKYGHMIISLFMVRGKRIIHILGLRCVEPREALDQT